MPPGCNQPTVSPQYWFTVCGQTGPAPGEAPAAPDTPAQLGQPIKTTGDSGNGTLELTPTTVVYATGQDTGTVPQRDGYIIIVVKMTNTSAATAKSTDLWKYTAGDGELLNTGVILGSDFASYGSALQPGSFMWVQMNYGIRNNQRGGVIEYTDGSRVVHRWQLPTQDTGPQIAEVKKGLR